MVRSRHLQRPTQLAHLLALRIRRSVGVPKECGRKTTLEDIDDAGLPEAKNQNDFGFDQFAI